MKLAVITDDERKQELVVQGLLDGTDIVWLTEPAPVTGAIACIDLLFSYSPGRVHQLEQMGTSIVLVSYVSGLSERLPAHFVRLNGWKTFLQRPVTEAAALNEPLREKAEALWRCFHKTIEWTPDQPGFIAARICSMIINEAYLALEEGVSTKAAIDTAMKLGTNYPYGPFEWAGLVGLKETLELLQALADQNSRFIPSALLQKEASQS